LVHIYTGDGKGKTTAALGLTLRALGSGLRVCFCQFQKHANTGEGRFLTDYQQAHPKQLFYKAFGGEFVFDQPSEENRLLVRNSLGEATRMLTDQRFDVVVLDELIVCLKLKLIEETQLLSVARMCPENTELILTGSGATPALMEIADLVTEMRCVKHYFHNGVPARKGIEW